MNTRTAPALAPGFLRRPLAHRGLHGPGRPENSRAAVRAAVAAGYGVEIDVHLSRDGVAMVFHDATLDRMTGAAGPVQARDAAELGALHLRGGDEGIPTLAEILDLVGGQVPLLIEIKDQSPVGGPGTDAGIGPLEAAVARLLDGWTGVADWVAVMSFNPASVAAMAREAPVVPRGLTTFDWPVTVRPDLPDATRAKLREIADFKAVGAAFVSHLASDLGRARVQDLRAQGVPLLCWTIRSTEAEAAARAAGACNVTFEGYLPSLPPAPPQRIGAEAFGAALTAGRCATSRKECWGCRGA